MSLLTGDRELLGRFRMGEQQALARVYKEYAPAVAAFLARGFTFSSKGRLLQFKGYHQAFDIENAIQETFARAFSAPARLAYDGLSLFRNYVMAIARNLVLSELRRREVVMSQLVRALDEQSTEVVPEELPGLVPIASESSSTNAEAQFLHEELLRLYQSFLEELKTEHREFFLARFEEHLTQIEAGRRAGLSHMQSRTLERKLRKRFLSFMQSRGYLEGYHPAFAVAALCLIP